MKAKKIDKNSDIYKIRHSMAHIMAFAVLKLYPDVKFGFGPPVEHGFYYDFDFGEHTLEEKDLKAIKKQMFKIINKGNSFAFENLSISSALDMFEKQAQIYKIKQINKLKKDGFDEVSVYTIGDFSDLCEGPHIVSTNELKDVAFSLDRISGAYWLGSEKNKMLTRIYALCYQHEEELKEFIERRKVAMKNDHKKLGKELDLFVIDDSVGKGLVLWTPNGTIIRDEIEKYAKEIEFRYNYKRVSTPHIAKEELYLQSGHLPLYAESMFPPITVEEDGEVKEKFYLKPMNCPHHHKIYASNLRSYKELPLRLAEYGTCYRFEQSGELSGLLRVRGLTMNDAHIYCSEEFLEEELRSILKMYMEVYDTFGLKNYYFRLSVRGKDNVDKFVGDKELWNKAEKALEDILNQASIEFEVGEGEAAFYGPKIDIQFTNLMGREETVSTIQVDFQAPIKFNLNYVSESGEQKRPVIIHRAPLSTHERFTSFLIEHFGGAFPVWMAPLQVMIIPVSNVFEEYCEKIKQELRIDFIRVESDVSDNSLNKKIRWNVKKKIPIILIVGENEVKKEEVTIRRYGKQEQQTVKSAKFIEDLKKEIKMRSL